MKISNLGLVCISIIVLSTTACNNLQLNKYIREPYQASRLAPKLKIPPNLKNKITLEDQYQISEQDIPQPTDALAVNELPPTLSS